MEGWPIVYLDKTYLQSTHTKAKVWVMTVNRDCENLHPKAQGNYSPHRWTERVINDALLIFKSQQKPGYYHDNMNYTNFNTWM